MTLLFLRLDLLILIFLKKYVATNTLTLGVLAAKTFRCSITVFPRSRVLSLFNLLYTFICLFVSVDDSQLFFFCIWSFCLYVSFQSVRESQSICLFIDWFTRFCSGFSYDTLARSVYRTGVQLCALLRIYIDLVLLICNGDVYNARGVHDLCLHSIRQIFFSFATEGWKKIECFVLLITRTFVTVI